ncbi:MAG TPA: hypothetical protein VFB79_21585 [Candidatus Angelobacter sp.]|nr:hypothetical protein [Candidatus Angelobacter sp.]
MGLVTSVVDRVKGWYPSNKAPISLGIAGIRPVQEAVGPLLFNLVSADPEDAKFKRITSMQTLRDLNPLMHERMQQVAFYLKSTTPFGKRIVEVITNYVVGEGFKAAAADPEVQAVIDKFCSDDINNVLESIKDWCDELTTFGELCIQAIVNPVNGAVRLGYVDPQEIEFVEYGTLTAADGSQRPIAFPLAVRLKRTQYEEEGKRLLVIRTDDDPNSETFGELTGDCFYAAINKAKGASRGLSELFSLADWIDVFDQMMFDCADRFRFLSAYVWHYTLTGADEKKVEAFKKTVTQNPPRQGSVQVTNENVKIEAQTPNLQGADMAETLRMIKMYGLGGVGLPLWFFADPVDANKSTADEMTGPTGKKLTERQNHLKSLVSKILVYVVQRAIYAGVLRPDVDATVTLQVPDLMIKDLEKAAMTLAAVVNSVSVMEQNGYIQSKTAARASHVVLSQIGVEVDPDEFEKAQQEKEQRQNNLVPEQTNLANALLQLQQQNKGEPEPAPAGGVQ